MRRAMEQAKGEVVKSLTIIDPLMTGIEATDRLIDQIVYKLYGLTEEDTAVVEGSGEQDKHGSERIDLQT